MDKEKNKIMSVNNALSHSMMDKSIKIDIACKIEECIINRLRDDGLINDYECSNASAELKKKRGRAS